MSIEKEFQDWQRELALKAAGVSYAEDKRRNLVMLDGQFTRPNKKEIIEGLRNSLDLVSDSYVCNYIALAAKFLNEECSVEDWSDQEVKTEYKFS